VNAVGYLRLSKWDEGSTSPARQREAIQKLAADRGWDLRQIHEDIDISGWNGAKRPGLEAMLAGLRPQDVVVVYRIDRLARSQQEFVRILKALEDAKVELVATDMTLDNTPSGTFVRDIIARLAQLESDNISARARAVMAHKRARGEPLGKVPYGWRRVGKHYERDEEQQAILTEAARRYVAGGTINQIAKDLGFSAAGPLSRMLHSTKVQEALPPELAGQLAQALLARRWHRVPESRQSLLGGIARCAECGGSMTVTATRAGRKNGRWYSYGCDTAGHAHISARWLDEFVSSQVLEAVDTGKLLEAIKRRKATGKTRKASELEARLELLEQAHFVDGTVPAARYKRLHDALIEQLAKAQESEHRDGFDLPAELARDLSATWPRLTTGERRRVIQACLERIEVKKAVGRGPVDPDRVAITWR
jgi:DNA invertase Pin-like site-specific DNA recombinase